MISANLSGLEYLDFLQGETTKIMIPTVTFLTAVAVLGLVGNSLVLRVNWRRVHRSPTSVFVVAMATFDLFTNSLAIPVEMYTVFHMWDFNNSTLCRCSRFFKAFPILSSGFTLVAIGVARYRKICKPFGRQVSVQKGKFLSAVVAVCAALISIPHAFVHGRLTKKTLQPGIHGYECGIDDSLIGTIWPHLYQGFLLLVFVCTYGSLITLYVLIGMKAWKHGKIYGASALAVPETLDPMAGYLSDTFISVKKSIDDTRNIQQGYTADINCSLVLKLEDISEGLAKCPECHNDSKGNCQVRKESETLTFRPGCLKDRSEFNGIADEMKYTAPNSEREAIDECKGPVTEIYGAYDVHTNPVSNERPEAQCSFPDDIVNENNTIRVMKRDKIDGFLRLLTPKAGHKRQSTILLLVVTLMCCLSFFLYPALMFFYTRFPDQYAKLSNTGLSVYQLFLRFYFINSATNPIIYNFCDRNFRRKGMKLINSCLKHQ